MKSYLTYSFKFIVGEGDDGTGGTMRCYVTRTQNDLIDVTEETKSWTSEEDRREIIETFVSSIVETHDVI